jgi:SAM-dependent methyltransferase
VTELFQPEYFQRIDESPDPEFYEQTRLVVHIDEGAIHAAGRLYASLLHGGEILDLMSSWRSHLPDEFASGCRVLGLGMNQVELQENPQLSDWVVHDLNAEPRLPFESDRFDGAIVTVSVQYLTRPVEVFAEVYRVLRPGARFIVTFSNRCFWTKAVAVWRGLDDEGHARLVALYLREAGFAAIETHRLAEWIEDVSDPLIAVTARKP